MSEPRRYLVAAGTRHYRELGELRGAHRDVGRIVDLFGAMGYERVPAEVSRDPDADEFENALADWCAGGGLTAGDVVVVYYAGHGDPPIAGPYRLACAGSVATRPRTWLSLENLAAILAESPVRDVLFIVDACHAGLGADELGAVTAAFAATRGRGEEPGSGTWVLASARRRELASDEGHFVTELARAHTAGDGASQRRLSPALLADRINRAFVTAGHAQRAVCSVTDQSIQPPFFPNPAFDPAAEIGPDGRAEGEASDLTAHFEPRGRGVEHVHDPGSYFTGRAHALDVVRTRLAGPGGRGPLAVTGAPGSGKSALLGRIVLEGDTAGGTPPIDVSINARHQTIDALIGRLAGAADVRASSVDALLAALAGRRAPYRVVVDSLDEAGPGHDIVEARRIAWELLRPLGDVPCVRLVVGSRRELLSDWCKHAPIVDLDTDAYADDTSVADYVERILADVRSPYADAPDTARVIAQAVARRAGRCFLVARMTASALLRQEPVKVTASGWADALPSDVDGAFRSYLERLPATRRATAFTLLTTLAFAEGHGLPRAGAWTAVASRLSGAAVCERDIDELVDEEGSYLTMVDVGEHRYFRLYHQELTDHLRERALAARSMVDIQACFVAALLGLVPPLPDGMGPNWDKAEPYVRYHLATHAGAAGTIGELITDPAFVLAAGPLDLLRAVRRARGKSMVPLVVERCAEVLRKRERDRAAHLAFVARATGEHEFADRALALSTSVERVWMEPRSVTPHQVIGHHGTGGFSVDEIDDNWWIEELRPRNRSLVLALPPAATCLHVWVPGDPSAARTLPHPNEILAAAAFVDAHDRPTAVTLDDQGQMRTWNVDDATWRPCADNPGYRSIVTAGVLSSGRAVVACQEWDGVEVLDVTTGQVVLRVEHRLAGNAPLTGCRLIRTPGFPVRLPLFRKESGAIVLYDPEGDPSASPEVLVDGLRTRPDLDIAENSRGETFLALVEETGTTTTVTLVRVAGRSLSFDLPEETADGRWGGFVRLDDDPTYIVGGTHTIHTLPMSGLPMSSTQLDRKPLSAVAMGNDGRVVVVRAGWKGAVHVVDATDGTPLGDPLLGHESAVCALRILASSSSDGLNILAAGADGTVRLWNWQPPTTTVPDPGTARRPTPVSVEARSVRSWRARPDRILVTSRLGLRTLDREPWDRPDSAMSADVLPGSDRLAITRRHEDDDGVVSIFQASHNAKEGALGADSSGSTVWHRLSPDGGVRTTRFAFPRHMSRMTKLHLIPPSVSHPRARLVSVDPILDTVEFTAPGHHPGTVWPLSAVDNHGAWCSSTALATSTGRALLLLSQGVGPPDPRQLSGTAIRIRDAVTGNELAHGRFETPHPVMSMLPFHTRTGTRHVSCVDYRGGYAVLDLTDRRMYRVGMARRLPAAWWTQVDYADEHDMAWVRLPSNDALLLATGRDDDLSGADSVHIWNSASPNDVGRLAVPAKRLLWTGNSPDGEALVLVDDEHGITLCHLPDGNPIWRTPLPARINGATLLADVDIALATQQGVVLVRPRISAAWRRRLGLGRG
ncbi:caspase family protein [Embleya sp. NPDC059237]|uniref:caspase family protein n=1 Tax=Embleya sp. NPDC059237 TaxID=3346784 RepID=UPI0036A93CA6